MELLIFFLGVIAAIMGYGFNNFALKPIQQFFNFRTGVGAKLTYYSNIITSPGSSDELAKEAHPILRGLAVDLEQYYLDIPFRKLFIRFSVIPAEELIVKAKGQLIYLSNSLYRNGDKVIDANIEAIAKIYLLLRIKELEGGNMISSAKTVNPNFKVE